VLRARHRPLTARRIAKIAVVVVLALCVVFFGYQYFFRHTLNPWSRSDQIFFHGRQYRGGAEVSPASIADRVRIGRAPWPDRDVFTTAPPIPHADPTGIVVYTWDRKYRSYGLVGGP
jgi:hypothetical protein